MTVHKKMTVVSMLVIGLASISAIEAGHKQVRRDPMVVLAFEIEDQARFIERRADRFAGRGRHREHHALVRLDQVRQQAREFRRTLQRFGPRSRRTDAELHELTRYVHRAGNTLSDLRAFRQVRGDFRQLTRMVDDVAYRLQTRTASHDRQHRHRRHATASHRGGSHGRVVIGKHTQHGYGSIGFSWGH